MDYPDLKYYEIDDAQKEEVRDLLKKLTLYNFYEKIDKEFKKTIVPDKCEICNEKLRKIVNAKDELIKLCKSVCNFILSNEDFQNFCKGESCKHSCLYMKFRLYDHVMKINHHTDDISIFFHALQSISKLSEARLENCDITNFNLKQNDFTYYKYLYEFLSTFFDITDKISEEYNSKDKLYCKHIKEFFRFYNSIRKNCTSRPTCGYYNIFDNIKTKLKTNDQLIFIYEKCKYELTECPQDTNIHNDIPCLKDKAEISKIPKNILMKKTV
ncbi:VIR protein [Plasmodium vivax]|uniref:VIR protein n=1 Tax=Plasmodium vivax TaxID=5855 RepID=A0A1G4E4I6_PLAVI|nr:VIR protein [Plasmodium vivax]